MNTDTAICFAGHGAANQACARGTYQPPVPGHFSMTQAALFNEARDLAAAVGKEYRPRRPWQNRPFAIAVANWYAKARNGQVPVNGALRRDSWDALAEHTRKQFAVLEQFVRVEIVTEDPYPTADAEAMFRDLDRGVMYVHDAWNGSHPIWDDETANMFRAVHDVFGHYAHRLPFDRASEDAAFRSHASMFPNVALPALASETRCQTCSLVYAEPVGEFKELVCVPAPQWVWQKFSYGFPY